MGSSRLPGKSLASLGGRPIIDWVAMRAGLAKHIEEVIVATSTDPEDDVLAEHVATGGWRVVRGDPTDVLSRFAQVLEEVSSDRVVRVTGDCPFVQPSFIDAALESLEGVDYVATGHDNRFPRGFDVEAIRRDALLAAFAEACDPIEREHVTPFIARRPDRFITRDLPCPQWARRPDLRLTLDEPDDLRLLRAVVEGLDADPLTLRGPDLIAFLDMHPAIASINRDISHNTER
jgi:spore coat polysaccharide biosynthesis protein SpsF